VLRLFRSIDAVRAESVSLRAVEIGALSYASGKERVSSDIRS
jgi:hypothetical protein